MEGLRGDYYGTEKNHLYSVEVQSKRYVCTSVPEFENSGVRMAVYQSR